jgi:hypothetical protein
MSVSPPEVDWSGREETGRMKHTLTCGMMKHDIKRFITVSCAIFTLVDETPLDVA